MKLVMFKECSWVVCYEANNNTMTSKYVMIDKYFVVFTVREMSETVLGTENQIYVILTSE